PEQDDVASRQLEETLDVRCVFRALRAFPRHAPVQAELTASTDGAHGPYFGHRYSITSSARVSSDGGTSRPSALAVSRLITSSNFVGCWTGRSAGLAPLRIRSTYEAARRYMSLASNP